MSDENLPQNRVLLYKAENGKVRVEVEFDGETVWLSQALLAELYQTTSQTSPSTSAKSTKRRMRGKGNL